MKFLEPFNLYAGGHTFPEHFVYKFQAALVASRRALTERKGALNTVHEILERLEAHLKADGQFTVRTLCLVKMFHFLFLNIVILGCCKHERK